MYSRDLELMKNSFFVSKLQLVKFWTLSIKAADPNVLIPRNGLIIYDSTNLNLTVPCSQNETLVSDIFMSKKYSASFHIWGLLGSLVQSPSFFEPIKHLTDLSLHLEMTLA